MTDQHPIITPPSDLRWLWREQAPRYRDGGAGREEWLMERAAGWGYDQRGEVNEAQLQKARDEELEACCESLRHEYGHYEEGADFALKLRAARRSKPPTLAEQGLTALRSTPCTEQCHYDALLAALNRLKQLEDSNG